MNTEQFIFKNKRTGEYWICRGATTSDQNKATRFNSEQAARFLRTTAHPSKWQKIIVTE